jgi:hypothetical protein
MPELFSSDSSQLFVNTCTLVDIENRWTIDKIAAWFEDDERVEDAKAEFQKNKEKGRNPIPEFVGLETPQNPKEAAQFSRSANDVLAWMVKKSISCAVADSILGKPPAKGVATAKTIKGKAFG